MINSRHIRVSGRVTSLLLFLIMTSGIFNALGLEIYRKFLVDLTLFISAFWAFQRVSVSSNRWVVILFILYVLSVCFSGVVHDDSSINLYRYLRYFIFGFVVFLIAKSAFYSEHDLRNFIRVIDIVVCIQIVASIVSFSVNGRLERIVGTMSTSGGSLATVWPLVFAPYYILRTLFTGRWSNLLFVAGLLFIGYASGKRAVYFLVPLSTLSILFFGVGRRMMLGFKGFARRSVLVSIVVVLFLFVGISGTQSLAQSNGFSFTAFNSAINYASQYSTAESAIDGTTIGRASSTVAAVTSVLNGDVPIYGFGVSDLIGESGFSQLNIGYGITGLIRELLSVGIIGALLYFLFYLVLARRTIRLRSRLSHFTNKNIFYLWLLSVSAHLSLLITFFGYSRVFAQSMNPLFFIMASMGLLFSIRNNGLVKN